MFWYPVLSCKVLCGKGVGCSELARNAVLWKWRELGRGVGLSHGVHWIGCLLVTLETESCINSVLASFRGMVQCCAQVLCLVYAV